MTSNYSSDNKGALFVNGEKKSAKSPDYSGQAVIDGVENWVSGWKRESKNGKKYLSLAFTPKEQKQKVIKEVWSGEEEETGFETIDVPF